MQMCINFDKNVEQRQGVVCPCLFMWLWHSCLSATARLVAWRCDTGGVLDIISPERGSLATGLAQVAMCQKPSKKDNESLNEDDNVEDDLGASEQLQAAALNSVFNVCLHMCQIQFKVLPTPPVSTHPMSAGMGADCNDSETTK